MKTKIKKSIAVLGISAATAGIIGFGVPSLAEEGRVEVAEDAVNPPAYTINPPDYTPPSYPPITGPEFEPLEPLEPIELCEEYPHLEICQEDTPEYPEYPEDTPEDTPEYPEDTPENKTKTPRFTG